MKRPSARYARRGGTIVFVSICLTALFSMAALAIDLGTLYIARAELQSASDSGSLAGAVYLQIGILEAGIREPEAEREQRLDLGAIEVTISDEDPLAIAAYMVAAGIVARGRGVLPLTLQRGRQLP